MAQVLLRSRSGRSIRELGTEGLPPDLSPYLPPEESLRKVEACFEGYGFRVFRDALETGVSIEGPPALFRKVFEVAEEKLRAVRATETLSLPALKEIQKHVEEIVLLPKPELHKD